MTLKLGTQSLSLNNVSATMIGDNHMTSAILVGAAPMLNFGLNNGMGIGAAVVASSGFGFIVGDTLTLTGLGGTCTIPPVITVTSVGSSGEILTHSISTAGNCPTPPSNPLDYTSSGGGYGAQYNGTWTAGALTNAIQIAGTGTGCVNGEILTGTGGSTPGGTPRQFQLQVTNAIGGVIQAGGVVITDTGSYGTPPPNPVPVTGSAACVGAQFNISKFSNSGGSLTFQRLHFIADAPGAWLVNAQFNVVAHSTTLEDLTVDTVQGSPNYWAGGFHLKGASLAAFNRIDVRNNLTYLNSNPAEAFFVLTSQNNMLGAYDYNWDKVSVAYMMGGGVQFIANPGDNGYQGINFHHFVCGLGAHCLRFTNNSSHAFGKVVIDDLYSGQTTQSIEMKLGQNVSIAHSGFTEGVTRVTSPPAQADLVVLDGVSQWMIHDNTCGAALTVTPSITCFHLKNGSIFGDAHDNIFANTARVPTFNGYVFDSTANGNLEHDDLFVGASSGLMTPVVDVGTGNTTVLTPPTGAPCASATALGLASGQPNITIPDNYGCLFMDNTVAVTTAAITMPAHPTANFEVKFTAFSTSTTTITLLANPTTGLQVMGVGMPTSISAATPFGVKNVSNRWQRI